uniref:Uncharacterized protein n=1 Tax=Molossus molossus TaxID=27622 RepID=A0A7J8I8S4_MOLMO|nr:hypothetical protein HJG59_010527 [Molossus molossus]
MRPRETLFPELPICQHSQYRNRVNRIFYSNFFNTSCRKGRGKRSLRLELQVRSGQALGYVANLNPAAHNLASRGGGRSALLSSVCKAEKDEQSLLPAWHRHEEGGAFRRGPCKCPDPASGTCQLRILSSRRRVPGRRLLHEIGNTLAADSSHP